MTKYCVNESCMMYGLPLSDDEKYCPECGEVPSDRSPEDHVHESCTNKEYNKEDSKVDYSTSITDSHDVINKVTNVYVGKSKDEQTLPERLTEYRKFCYSKMRSGIVSAKLRNELDEFAVELNLDEEQKKEVELSVKKSRLLSTRETLSKAEMVDLENTINKIWQNSQPLNVIKENLAPFADSESDEAQFYHYMISSIENPRMAISNYNKTGVDHYWQTFWVCYAYRKQGQNALAKQTVRKLQNWEEYPEDNINIVYCMLNLLDEELSDAKVFLSHTDLNGISDILIPFRDAILFITEYGKTSGLSDSLQCNFYLQKIFGVGNNSYHEKPVLSANVDGSMSTSFSAPPPPRQATEKSVSSVQDALNNIDRATPKEDHKSVENTQKINVGPVKDNNFIKKNLGWIIAAACVVLVLILLIPSKSDNDSLRNVPENKNLTSEGTGNKVSIEETKEVSGKQTVSTPTVVNGEKKSRKTENASTNEVSSGAKANISVQEPSKVVAENKAVKEDPIVTLRKSAEAGNKDARFNLGMRYYNGDGVKKDYSTAFSYLKPLADEGYDKAYFPVAEMYHGGRGVAKDRNAAEAWYTKAAKAGNAKAKRILMNM